MPATRVLVAPEVPLALSQYCPVEVAILLAARMLIRDHATAYLIRGA